LTREIASLWQSDEVSRSKPSPQNEAERGTLVVETVMYEALPSFLRKLNATMLKTLGKSLPLQVSPVIFSSWMGGDRDGNPNVRAETTREVCLKQRAQAAGLLARDILRLQRELSLTNCCDEMRILVGEKSREPYRSFLKPVRYITLRYITLHYITWQWNLEDGWTPRKKLFFSHIIIC
jgi:phosphoenolpyruvate carboxylase